MHQFVYVADPDETYRKALNAGATLVISVKDNPCGAAADYGYVCNT